MKHVYVYDDGYTTRYFTNPNKPFKLILRRMGQTETLTTIRGNIITMSMVAAMKEYGTYNWLDGSKAHVVTRRVLEAGGKP